VTVRRGRVTAERVSPATRMGDCWHCGHGRLWHRVFRWFIGHTYLDWLDVVAPLGGPWMDDEERAMVAQVLHAMRADGEDR
jgi:hypothetical protein